MFASPIARTASAPSAETLPPTSDLDEDITTIEQEMIIKSLRRGYRMAEVATHEYVRANGESNFRVQDVWSRYLYSLVLLPLHVGPGRTRLGPAIHCPAMSEPTD